MLPADAGAEAMGGDAGRPAQGQLWTNITGAECSRRESLILQKGHHEMSTYPTVIKHKLGLLKLAEKLGNVSNACKEMGYSMDTFYRYKQAVDYGGVEALIDKS